jgi:nicotinate-nucleotide adenylyltransferase
MRTIGAGKGERPVRLPPHAPGLRIGLFGGSFDPPHEGHLLASRLALTRLRLDRLWWLVTPGNPLKDTHALTPLAQRLAAARHLARDPRIVVTDLETQLRSRYTVDLLLYLRRHCPGVRFVWIMGTDNLLQFHRWRRWEEIMRQVPVAVIDRPGTTLRAATAKAVLRRQHARMPENAASRLAQTPPPAIVILHGPRSKQSSSALRARIASADKTAHSSPST